MVFAIQRAPHTDAHVHIDKRPRQAPDGHAGGDENVVSEALKVLSQADVPSVVRAVGMLDADEQERTMCVARTLNDARPCPQGPCRRQPVAAATHSPKPCATALRAESHCNASRGRHKAMLL